MSEWDQVKTLYRYEDWSESLGVDEFDNPIPGGRTRVSLREYPVVRCTPRGVWIRYYGAHKEEKFVNLQARKQFACTTLIGAKVSFTARKQRQHRILTAQLRHVNNALHEIQRR